MALNNTTADALATALCSALNVTDPTSVDIYKTIYRTIYAHLKTDIAVTLPINTVVTTGSAVTQTGPTTPVTMNPA